MDTTTTRVAREQQYEDAKGLKLTARILNVDATEKFPKKSLSTQLPTAPQKF